MQNKQIMNMKGNPKNINQGYHSTSIPRVQDTPDGRSGPTSKSRQSSVHPSPQIKSNNMSTMENITDEMEPPIKGMDHVPNVVAEEPNVVGEHVVVEDTQGDWSAVTDEVDDGWRSADQNNSGMFVER
eukprot:UN28708